MKILFTILLSFSALAAKADFVFDNFVARAQSIPFEELRGLPLMQNGRIKPFASLARETSIFITGSYQFKGMDPIQLIIALMMSEDAENLQMIEVRSPELRTVLKLPEGRRHYSLKELMAAGLEQMATPLLEKQKTNKRSLTEVERKAIETFEQAFSFQQARSGALIVEAMDPAPENHGQSMQNSPVVEEFKLVMQAISTKDNAGFQTHTAELKQKLKNQNWPEAIRAQVNNVDSELFYLQFKPFRWACWLFFFFAFMMSFGKASAWVQQKIPRNVLPAILFIPLAFLAFGFYLRVSITGFAPVTNMYGTMIWVSLGVSLFGWVFHLIYRNPSFLALTFFGSFLLLLITEQMPLVISPDMDPIVAVLRSNLWLTIHVLTITISYAAFSIAMLLGNTMIIRDLLKKTNPEWTKTYGHFCYRAIQLGVFLLSVGIILGGVWADYSWGRFWGWDPKETWALIADLGFIALLHSRIIGWVDSYRLLLLAPLSYLLVIMAWYGVNFILATGLHSYGFSSGGAAVVAVFVSVQLLLILGAFSVRMVRKTRSV